MPIAPESLPPWPGSITIFNLPLISILSFITLFSFSLMSKSASSKILSSFPLLIWFFIFFVSFLSVFDWKKLSSKMDFESTLDFFTLLDFFFLVFFLVFEFFLEFLFSLVFLLLSLSSSMIDFAPVVLISALTLSLFQSTL